MRSQSNPSSSRISSVCSANPGAGPRLRCGRRRTAPGWRPVPIRPPDTMYSFARICGVVGGLQGVLHRRPRPGQGGEPLAPLRAASAWPSLRAESRTAAAVFSAIDSAVANRGSSTRSVEVDVPAHVGPELRRLHHHQGDVAVVGGRVHPHQRVDRRAVHARRGLHHQLAEVAGQRDGVAHRPQPAAQQGNVHDRRLAGALALEQRGRDAAREVGARDGVAVRRARAGRSCRRCRAG